MLNHSSLPLIYDAANIFDAPWLQRHSNFARDIVNINDIENEDHVELSTFAAYCTDDFVDVAYAWHLAYCDSIIFH